jgi:hypothetical protein
VAFITRDTKFFTLPIAQKSTSIFHKTTQVLEQANANQDISANLGAAVEFFKI